MFQKLKINFQKVVNHLAYISNQSVYSLFVIMIKTPLNINLTFFLVLLKVARIE